jgi:ParB/RepB/Spo0J family partition protein
MEEGCGPSSVKPRSQHMLSNKVKKVEISSIKFNRDERQRKEIDTSDIDASIRLRGVLTPICITESSRLIFGERRLTSAKKAGHTHILARIAPDNLSEHDLQLLELEENIMRKDLPWDQQVVAMQKLHELSGSPPMAQFAETLGYKPAWVYKCLQTAREILNGNERVIKAQGLTKAVNVIDRQRQRDNDNLVSDIIDTIGGTIQPPLLTEAPPILNESFLEWAPDYSGPKFNVIHCDFPYGIDLDDSDQMAGTNAATYTDTPDTFWQLLSALRVAQENVISSSAHMIFWHSMKEELYLPMRQYFQTHFSEWTFEDYPLIWMKSDNRGIAPDVTRRPRRIYETALFGWRGDRKLVKFVSNAYAAPKETSSHPSTKPEPMLRHYLSMVVDSHARVLDPTCGSGSALRAAESLGAGSILGLEVDRSFAEDAIARLNKSRALARAAGAMV